MLKQKLHGAFARFTSFAHEPDDASNNRSGKLKTAGDFRRPPPNGVQLDTVLNGRAGETPALLWWRLRRQRSTGVSPVRAGGNAGRHQKFKNDIKMHPAERGGRLLSCPAAPLAGQFFSMKIMILLFIAAIGLLFTGGCIAIGN
jgi:hypothetical protein